MDRMQAVCFSGHRNVHFNMDDSDIGRIFQQELTNTIKNAINAGYNTFYTGMAKGFDIIAAEAVLHERYDHQESIKLMCIIPYRGQESKWAQKWQKRHDRVLKASDGVQVLNDGFVTGCYHERNRHLVDNASLLIGLYSGKAGGTSHTFDYAEQRGLKIVNIWDKLGGYLLERTTN